jgi:predicted transcriptional regulator
MTYMRTLLSPLQRRILWALKTHGPMSQREIVDLFSESAQKPKMPICLVRMATRGVIESAGDRRWRITQPGIEAAEKGRTECQ